MKKLILLLIVSLTIFSCAEEKQVKFIPLTTDSLEAKAAFIDGIFREDQNEINESLEAFKKAIDLDNDFLIPKIFYNSTPSENRERLLEAYDKRESASEIEQKIIEAFYQMNIYGNSSEAIKIFDSLITEYSDIPFLYERTANMKAFNKDFDEAISYWEKALELNPNSYFSALRLGLLHINVGDAYMMMDEEKRDLKEGEKWLKLASKIRPDASATPRFLGNVYRTELKLDKALEAYKLSVKKNTEKTSQLMVQNLMVGHTLSAMGKHKQAREAYNTTINFSINTFWWAINHNYYAFSLLSEKKYDEAIRFLSNAQIELKTFDDSKEIIDWSIDRIEFIKWLIISHSQRKDESMVSMDKIIEFMNTQYEKDLENAVDEMERERLSRNYKSGLLFRSSWSNILFGEYDSARFSLNQMYEILSDRLDEDPDALNGYHSLSGYLNLMEGNIEESLSMYEKRKERGDMDEYHSYFYALSLKASGEQEKSKEIMTSIANSAFSDWTIAMVKNLAKSQIQKNL